MHHCRIARAADLTSLELMPCRTLLVSASGLENAKKLVTNYKEGRAQAMTPEIWRAKKIVDSTLHPGILLLHVLTTLSGF